MTDVSQNGWPVLQETQTKLWVVPNARWTVPLAPGAAGYLLATYAAWFNNIIEGIGSDGDDHGWGLRKIGSTDIWSNHSSGTAIDLNALLHPQGQHATFTTEETDLIHRRMQFYEGVLRWGGDFHTTVDEMHVEVVASREAARELKPKIHATYWGRIVTKATG